MPIVIKWNPAQEMFAVDETLTHLLAWTTDAQQAKKTERASDWTPSADISETADAIIVQVELAGIDQASLQILFHDGSLMIQGKRPFYPNLEPARIYRIERTYGTFQRTFAIPKPVDPEHITASYSQGMLTITLMKRTDPVTETIRVPVVIQ
jgi:HSP20 family protein